MNAINGSLAKFMAERLMKREVKPIKTGILYQKRGNYTTPEGDFIQSVLIGQPLKEVRPSKFWSYVTVFAVIIALAALVPVVAHYYGIYPLP